MMIIVLLLLGKKAALNTHAEVGVASYGVCSGHLLCLFRPLLL